MDIIQRLRAKEESALKEIMSQYGSYLMRTVYLTVRDTQLAEEIVQDTFVTAFKKIYQLKENEKLKSWLTTIAINRCRSTLRRKELKQLSIDNHSIDLSDEQQSTPEEQLLEVIQTSNLSEAIMQLDYKYREVIVLHYFGEYSIREIASHTDSKEGTIKSRLTRGRTKLYELLKQEGRN